MKREYTEINMKVKIPFHKRTQLNYTHDVNVDNQISSISAWRKSKTKFNKNFIKNILSLGILHIISLFFPKLYLKLYCKPCPPKESDFFLIEDINGFATLSKSKYKKPKNGNSSSNYENNFSKKVSFEFCSMKYEYDDGTNTIVPVYFNLNLIKNNELLYKYGEGLNSEQQINSLTEKYGLNIMRIKKNIFYEYIIKLNIEQIIVSILTIFFLSIGDENKFAGFIFYVSFISILVRGLHKFITFRKIYYGLSSLDDAKHLKKYKVLRRNMQKSLNKYSLIKNTDILPGDVLFLSEKDFIPCDGVILEGECILNINFLLGNIDRISRKALENNNNYFSYVNNKNNIVFHGMKIMKIFTKNISKEITILAINTGANTFKANLFSNFLLKNKDKKIFRNKNKNKFHKYYISFTLTLVVLSIIVFLILYYKYKDKINYGKKFYNYFYVIMGIVFMPIHFITENVIKLISMIHLNNHKILCLDESKITEVGNIDTVIFSKSGNQNKYKIISFCPLYFKPGTKKILIKEYIQNEEQNITNILDIHMNYFKKVAKDIENKIDRKSIINTLNNLDEDLKNEELNAFFLESIICCSGLIKINNEICGEEMEKEILEKMNWDINSTEIKDENNDNPFSNQKELNERLINLIGEIRKKGSIFINNYDNNINYNSSNIISEVFPKDYYKITEEKFKEKRKDLSIKKNDNNQDNIMEKRIYKLIIIQTFNNDSYWSKSCISYNLLNNKCLFMTKGLPDKILKCCIPNSIPGIDIFLSNLIKEGHKIIVYAVKKLELYQIGINKNEDYYMKDLIFVGFILIENRFKKEMSNIIEKINKMNCNNSLSSIISTNDNVYNAIEGGLKSGIISKNNVYVFDIENYGLGEKVIYAKYLYDKEEKSNDHKNKQKLHDKNTLLSLMNEKGIKQNDLIGDKTTNNDELAYYQQDSSRKMVSQRNEDILENFNKNFTTSEEKDNSKKRELNSLIFNSDDKNIITNFNHASFHQRTLDRKNTSFFLTQKNLFFNGHESELSFNNLIHSKINSNKNDENISIFNNSHRDSKFDDLYNDINLYQFYKSKKRRPTTKANLNFTFRNSVSQNYECLFFKRYDNQIKPFKHDCDICFSGELLKYIYNEKEKLHNRNSVGFENYKLDILMTFLKYRVKIFYSMNPEEKAILIKLYRKYFNKSVCLIGNSSGDMESISLSNVGIMVGPPINFNTLFCHYYLCDKNLLQIEKIIKNGRSFYENFSLLVGVSSLFTLLSLTLIIISYILNSQINSARYVVLNCSVFFLCLSAFSIQPNYEIDVNYLITNSNLFMIYSFTKTIIILIEKGLIYILLWITYRYNEELTEEKNYLIFANYHFLLTWSLIASLIFGFNMQTLFRRHVLNNLLFIFLYFLFIIYLITNLTLSDICFDNFRKILLLDFEPLKKDIDAFEDHHKITILYIIIADFLENYIFNILLQIIFERYANKTKFKEKKNKKDKL